MCLKTATKGVKEGKDWRRVVDTSRGSLHRYKIPDTIIRPPRT